MTLLESLRRDLYRALEMLAIMRPNKLYETAYNLLGMDVSPQDNAPDELGCVESLSKIIQKAYPELNFPLLLSTRELYAHLLHSITFQEVDSPVVGDIILSVTGTGNGSVKNGHTGIVGKHWIMSNDSRNGMWTANYTLDGWKNYFEKRGGMATHFYRYVG